VNDDETCWMSVSIIFHCSFISSTHLLQKGQRGLPAMILAGSACSLQGWEVVSVEFGASEGRCTWWQSCLRGAEVLEYVKVR
jgi:hypothetical protein